MTAATPKIRLRQDDWRPGAVLVYGTKHTIRANAARIGTVHLIYELQSGGRFRFMGIEKISTPDSEFADDTPSRVEHLPFRAVARNTWIRIYKDDLRRRRSYDEAD